MRVVLNSISTCGRQRTGVGFYTAELGRSLAQLAPDKCRFYPPAWLRLGLRTYHALRDWMPKKKPAATSGNATPSAAATSPQRSLQSRLLERHFRRYCRVQGADLYHEPNFLAFQTDRPTILTIHDLSVLANPDWHPPERVRDYESRFERGFAQCAHVVTVSEFTRQEVIRSLNVPAEKVTRTYNGVRRNIKPLPFLEVQPVLNRLRLPSRYLLHVGTLEPRKNLLFLMQAYADLPESVRAQCPLVLVGGWGWKYQSIRNYLEGEGRDRNIRRLGYVSEADLPALYNGATALVVPSHYEGFGLPAAEMLACGGAVLASTADALKEILGPCGQTLDPQDRGLWTLALKRVIVDDDYRQSLRTNALKQSLHFTWDRCAQETWRVYQKVLNRHPSRKAA